MTTTTLDEHASKELARIGSETTEGLAALEGLKIDTKEEMEGYSDLLVEVITKRKGLEEMKARATKPMNDALKEIRSWFAPAEQGCAALEARIKDAITAYRIKAGETIASARTALQGASTVDEAKDALASIADAEAADEGPTTTRKTWDFTVALESEIPREYLTLDTLKVKAAIKDGVREIPGLIIMQVASTVMKRRKKTSAT